MEEDIGREITFLKVDGGASGNNFLLQFQADILGKECIGPSTPQIICSKVDLC